MHIKGPQHQTPSVMGVPMLRIVDGCTHGRCRFCNIFHDKPFAMAPEEEIEEDLEELSHIVRSDQRRLNLIGGNPYSLPMKKLIPLLDRIKEKLPDVISFGGFCRIADIKNKSDEDLAFLKSYGVNELSIGAESGYDPALAFMDKGHTAADVVEQGKRLHKAGIDFSYFYLVGMAGAGKGQENALATAKAFSEAEPDHVLVVCITPCSNWKLAEDIEAGRWVPPSEMEMIEEIRTFVEHLDCTTYVNCSHDTDIIRFEGLAPKDTENMLTLIDHRKSKVNLEAARRLRELIHHASFDPKKTPTAAVVPKK